MPVILASPSEYWSTSVSPFLWPLERLSAIFWWLLRPIKLGMATHFILIMLLAEAGFNAVNFRTSRNGKPSGYFFWAALFTLFSAGKAASAVGGFRLSAQYKNVGVFINSSHAAETLVPSAICVTCTFGIIVNWQLIPGGLVELAHLSCVR